MENGHIEPLRAPPVQWVKSISEKTRPHFQPPGFWPLAAANSWGRGLDARGILATHPKHADLPEVHGPLKALPACCGPILMLTSKQEDDLI